MPSVFTFMDTDFINAGMTVLLGITLRGLSRVDSFHFLDHVVIRDLTRDDSVDCVATLFVVIMYFMNVSAMSLSS